MGTCQTCLLRADDFDIPAGARTGLPKNLIVQNYFLACLLYPDSDLKLSQAKTSDLFREAIVIEKNKLTDSVLQLFLEPSEPLDFFAGQFINLKSANDLVRSYSLACNPADSKRLELHVKLMRNGQMSNWLFNELQVGETVEFQGATGNSFYNEVNLDQPLLLIGTGTGLAPLLSIVRYAISQGHRGEIILYHGTRYSYGLYQNKLLIEMANTVDNFSYFACLSGGVEFNGTLLGRANELAMQRHKDLTGWQVFVCGEPLMVKDTQQRAYLAGANLDEIHVDPFNLRDLRRRRRK